MSPFQQHSLGRLLDKGASVGLLERASDAYGNRSVCLPAGVQRAMDRALESLRAANPGASEDELRQRAALKVALAIVGRGDLEPAKLP
jgi:hypothetical protein